MPETYAAISALRAGRAARIFPPIVEVLLAARPLEVLARQKYRQQLAVKRHVGEQAVRDDAMQHAVGCEDLSGDRRVLVELFDLLPLRHYHHVEQPRIAHAQRNPKCYVTTMSHGAGETQKIIDGRHISTRAT